MSLITIKVLSKNERFDEIIAILNKLEKKIMNNTELVAQIAESVRANTDIINSVNILAAKVFDEVQKLVSAANAEVPGLAELRDATLAQTELLVKAVHANTAIDGLIPDAEVTPEVAPAPSE